MIKAWAVFVIALGACSSPVVADPSPPTSTVERAECSNSRLTFLVEQFFARYNARDLDGFLALFNWASPAAGGGFGSYHDNPGQVHQPSDRASLSAYLRERWALDDRLSIVAAHYPEIVRPPNANPTIEFTRMFSGVTQSGNAKLVCNAGLLVNVVMSST